jgi:hypothetical protein
MSLGGLSSFPIPESWSKSSLSDGQRLRVRNIGLVCIEEAIQLKSATQPAPLASGPRIGFEPSIFIHT